MFVPAPGDPALPAASAGVPAAVDVPVEALLAGLVQLAAVVTMSGSGEALTETVAEQARLLLRSSSLSIGRFEREQGRLRTLINVGELAAWEERWPKDESYAVVDFAATLAQLTAQPDSRRLVHVDDPQAGAGEAALLRSVGKVTSISVPVAVDGQIWGELWAARTAELPPYTTADLDVATLIAALVSAGVSQADYLRDVARQARTDALTGLGNRRAVDEQLAAAFEIAAAHDGALSVLLADVNNLKRVNDSQGHAAGDRLLREVGTLFTVVASHVPSALAARLGGDEFCLLLPGIDGPAAERHARALAAAAGSVAGTDRPLLAVGVVTAGGRRAEAFPADVEALLRSADVAQYEAKRSRTGAPVARPWAPTTDAPDRRGAADRRATARVVATPTAPPPTPRAAGIPTQPAPTHPAPVATG